VIRNVSIRALAIEPIHHGAGTSGNTALLRRQNIVTPDGESVRVPFVSGNSLKHRIRYHAAKFMIEALEVEDGTLAKGEIDLLFSGGSLTKSGSVMDVARARKVAEWLPAVSMCGYSCGNVMTESKIMVANLHMVCSENAWRLPADLEGSPHASRRCNGSTSEEFGTRHDTLRGQQATRLVDSESGADSVQMIYDFEVINAGAMFWSAIRCVDLTPREECALASSFLYGSDTESVPMHVGAKASTGYGLVKASIEGLPDADLGAYSEWLKDNKGLIMETLKEVTR